MTTASIDWCQTVFEVFADIGKLSNKSLIMEINNDMPSPHARHDLV